MGWLKIVIKLVYLCKIPLLSAKLRAVSTSALGLATTKKAALDAVRQEAVVNGSARLTLALLPKTLAAIASA